MTDTITITGNVATDPEFKRTPAGVGITTFRVASGQRRYDRATSAWVDAGTNWYSVSAFRGLADHAYTSLHKGDRVLLTGRLRLREWDNGTRRGIAVEIDAEAIGHDLLWGTTTFVKTSGSASADQSGWQAPPADGDAWAAPGISPRGPEAAPAAAPTGREGSDASADGMTDLPRDARDDVLVAVGGGADSDVPF